MKIIFKDRYGLGDILATIYCLENCGRQTNKYSVLCGSEAVEEAVGLFDLKYVKYTKDAEGAVHSLIIRGDKSTAEYPQKGYIHYISRISKFLTENCNFNPAQCQSIPPINKNIEKSNEVLVQFETNFARHNGFEIKKKEIDIAIKAFAKYKKISIIGGKNTPKYLGKKYNYKLGDLNYIKSQLLSCDFFLGADSGMAHLAGVLGVPSKVIILIPHWYCDGGLNRNDGQNITNPIQFKYPAKINESLIDYYRCYPNTKVYTRWFLYTDIIPLI